MFCLHPDTVVADGEGDRAERHARTRPSRSRLRMRFVVVLNGVGDLIARLNSWARADLVQIGTGRYSYTPTGFLIAPRSVSATSAPERSGAVAARVIRTLHTL